MVKLYTQFKTQDSEINKAFSSICHRDEIRGVPPPPPQHLNQLGIPISVILGTAKEMRIKGKTNSLYFIIK